MRFYTGQHQFYCGIDLYARKMYLCFPDAKGETRPHRNMDTDRDAFLRAIEPYRDDIVVAVECMFAWYWIADLCKKRRYPHVLCLPREDESNKLIHEEEKPPHEKTSGTFGPYPEYQQPVQSGKILRKYRETLPTKRKRSGWCLR